ncbi:hypothetical protein ATK36_2752 [Amycolatopsis sulphurea]|uniref:Uncharacterized protein n=1 Tax=Amycolatopsis sulphurea TaxID=76022 RepID=A0A2A9FB31_9PSEU|nr:hypothetical protein [Amycolatopsis sulphurea]PFG47700.1 hypothetical protein ATK36_2752 [Amycolatopsis sulphurea]
MSQPAQQPGWLDGLNFSVGDVFGSGEAAGAATSGGQGFALSHDDAMSMLNLAKSVREDFRDMRPDAEQLTRLTSPADEPGSNGYNTLLVNRGQPPGAFVAGETQVNQLYAYADELVKRLEKALGITRSSDEQAGADVKNAASSGQGGGFA